MSRRFVRSLLAMTLMLGAPTAIKSAAAKPLQAAVPEPLTSEATDTTSRRHHRHPDNAHRPYHQPYYYARPYYYRPYPYDVPAPFVFGFGFAPWVW
jgi:hypothetical protein